MADTNAQNNHAICDYEGTSYRANFWDGHSREYEDLAERIALRRLLPPTGQRLLDIGAGFGRLVDLYEGHNQIVLLDYAKSGLQEAQARLGRSERFIYVAADIYRLPLAPSACDTVVSVRVLHHLRDVPAALQAIACVLRPGGTYVLEYANKRNIKSIARYILRRQRWSPFGAEPYEFVELNYDFHPAWMARELARAGFTVDAGLAASHFRHPLFKRLLPASALATVDGVLQQPAAAWKLAPSVFLRGHTEGSAPLSGGSLFVCPECRSQDLAEAPESLTCQRCGAVWAITDGIYDFKAPISPTRTANTKSSN